MIVRKRRRPMRRRSSARSPLVDRRAAAVELSSFDASPAPHLCLVILFFVLLVEPSSSSFRAAAAPLSFVPPNSGCPRFHRRSPPPAPFFRHSTTSGVAASSEVKIRLSASARTEEGTLQRLPDRLAEACADLASSGEDGSSSGGSSAMEANAIFGLFRQLLTAEEDDEESEGFAAEEECLPESNANVVPVGWCSSILEALSAAAAASAAASTGDDSSSSSREAVLDKCAFAAETVLSRMILDGCQNVDAPYDCGVRLPPPDLRCYDAVLSILASSAKSRGRGGSAAAAAAARRAAWYVRAMERGRAPLPGTTTAADPVDNQETTRPLGEDSNEQDDDDDFVLSLPPPPKPGARSYAHLVTAWAESRDENAAQRIRSILQRAQETNEVRPNRETRNALLLAYSNQDVRSAARGRGSKKSGKGGQGEEGDPTVALKAEEILSEMWGDFDKEKDDALCPDATSYNLVMDCWSESLCSDAPFRIRALMSDMSDRDITPNVDSYNALIQAYGKSCAMDPDAPDDAERVLHVEMGNTADGGIVPNVKSYNRVLAAYARPERRGGSAVTASHLLSEMEELGGEHSGCAPNLRSYTAVVSAWARSGAKDKAERALAVLDRAEERLGKGSTDAGTHNAVLNACAFSGPYQSDPEGCRRPFAIAVSVFNRLRARAEEQDGSNGDGNGGQRRVAPNHITYGTLLKCCANLLPSSLDGDDDGRRRQPSDRAALLELKEKVVEKTFLQCRSDGMVGDIVLANLRGAASDRLWEKLLGEYVGTTGRAKIRGQGRRKGGGGKMVRTTDLPWEWTRNVTEGRGYGYEGRSTRGR